MRTTQLIAALALILCTSEHAAAQALTLEFNDGKVRLVAENVPLGRILAEWSRIGRTTIVNGDRVPGAPLTLQLVDVPERQALDVLLRSAAGYMVAARETPAAANLSVLDRILVLATTSRAPAPPPVPQPPARTVAPPPFVVQDDDTDDLGPEPDVPAGPRRRVEPGLVDEPPLDETLDTPEPLDIEEDEPPLPEPAPGNPFAPRPGSNQPGSIAPVPQTTDDDGPPEK